MVSSAGSTAASAPLVHRLGAVCQKTRMCRFFVLGKCGRGRDCSFAHGAEEIVATPDLGRTKICPAILRDGRCDNSRCNFAHSKGELRKVVLDAPGNQHRRRNNNNGAAAAAASNKRRPNNNSNPTQRPSNPPRRSSPESMAKKLTVDQQPTDLPEAGHHDLQLWSRQTTANESTTEDGASDLDTDLPSGAGTPQKQTMVRQQGGDDEQEEEKEQERLTSSCSTTPQKKGGSASSIGGADSSSSGSSDNLSVTEQSMVMSPEASTSELEQASTGRHRNKFRKTRMCSFFLAGTCKKKTSCSFAHAEAELLPFPDLRYTKLCPAMLRDGSCTEEGCTFAHDNEELKNDLAAAECMPSPDAQEDSSSTTGGAPSEPVTEGTGKATLRTRFSDEPAEELPLMRETGTLLRVKNTFLDVDEAPGDDVPQLRRSQSAPGRLVAAEECRDDDDEDEPAPLARRSSRTTRTMPASEFRQVVNLADLLPAGGLNVDDDVSEADAEADTGVVLDKEIRPGMARATCPAAVPELLRLPRLGTPSPAHKDGGSRR